MRIAYLARTQIPDISANSVQSVNVCAAFAGLGHSVTFFVINSHGSINKELRWEQIAEFYDVRHRFEIKKINVPQIKDSRLRYLWSSISSVFAVRRALRKDEFDVVFTRDVLSAWASTGCRLGTFLETHTPVWMNRLERYFFKRLISSRYFLKLVSITKTLGQAYLEKYPALEDGIMIAPDGAEIIDDQTQEKIDGITLGSLGKLKVGYVGHLYRGKGLEVIEAVAPGLQDVEFHIIGGQPEDLEFWRGRIKEKNVFFHGFVHRCELGRYYDALDICLLPNQETVWASGSSRVRTPVDIGSFTSPLKMFEYMAHGKPIIASDLPVLREVLHEGISVLVPPQDFEKWKTAIAALMDPGLRAKLGKAAKDELEKYYSWTARAESILAYTPAEIESL